MINRCVLIMMLCATASIYTMDQSYRIHGSEGESSAFEVSSNILRMSPTLAGLIGDLGDNVDQAIPFTHCSTKTLKDLMEILKTSVGPLGSLESMRNKAQSYSISELIDISNCAHYLGFSEAILNVFKDIINSTVSKKKFKSSHRVPVGKLNTDFTRHYVSPGIMSETMSYIKIRMLKKNSLNRMHIMKTPVKDLTTYALAGIFLNNNAWIAISTVNNKQVAQNILIFDAVSNKQLYTLSLDFHAIQLVAYKNSYLVCRERHGDRIRIFNMQDPDNIMYYDYRLPGVTSIKSMEFNPEGSFLVLTNNHKKVGIIDMNAIDWSTTPISFDIAKVSFLDAPVGNSSQDKILFTDDSTCMVASLGNKSIDLSRLNCVAKVVTSMTIPQEKVESRCCSFDRDGKRLAVFSNVGKKSAVVVFNTETMKKTLEFNGPRIGSLYPISVQFSPDGLWVVCIKNHSISFYDSMTGERLLKIGGLLHNKSVCMSSDGNKIMITGSSSTVLNNCFGLVYTLLTPEEEAILQKMSHCDFDQLQLIRDLCYTLMRKGSVEINESSAAYTLFTSLDKDIQQLLQSIGITITSLTNFKKLLSRPKDKK